MAKVGKQRSISPSARLRAGYVPKELLRALASPELSELRQRLDPGSRLNMTAKALADTLGRWMPVSALPSPLVPAGNEPTPAPTPSASKSKPNAARDAAIKKRWENGERPGKNKSWPDFQRGLIEDCPDAQTVVVSKDGHKTETLARGFGLRQIQRRIDELKESKVLI